MALAIPAKPGIVKHTQKDGSVISYRLVGDEFNNRIIVDDLYTVLRGEDGDLYYAAQDNGRLVNTGVLVRPMSRLNEAEKQVARESIGIQSYAFNPLFNASMHTQKVNNAIAYAAKAPAAPNESALELGEWGGEIKGNRNMLVILVEYTDIRFSVEDPKTKFTKMLNDKGYSDNGGTGSARDYYVHNSNGQFNPTFDVYGPFTLSHERSYYGGNDANGSDKRAAAQTKEACDLASASGVDFSKYDADGDGYIDLAFIVYAGHNPAEHGPDEAIWPHLSYVVPGYNITDTSEPRYDGKILYKYACTSELQGNQGAKMTSIGTFCHEFGHSIGLPDFYDTDYSGGFGLAYASIMNSGSYLNSGATPPSYNTLERWLVGWNLPEEIEEAGRVELQHVSKDGGRIMWANEHKTECFLFEARPSGANVIWDKYLNQGDPGNYYEGGNGLLILHVDWSGAWIQKWHGNNVNDDPNHQCATIFTSSPTPNSNNGSGWFFPGANAVSNLKYDSTPAFQGWLKNKMPFDITEIAIEGAKVSFNASLEGLTTVPRQYDVLIDWSKSEFYDASAKWTVSYTNQTTAETQTITTSNNYIVIYPTSTDTYYSVQIFKNNDAEPTVELHLTTQGNVFSPRSALNISTELRANEYIRLSVKNLECTPEQIVWKVDDKIVEPYLKLSAGKHKVNAEITDTEGNVHHLWKYITVGN